MRIAKSRKFEPNDTPKNIRQYERRMRKILTWILSEKLPRELSPWDYEILDACVSKGYIADNLCIVRTCDGECFADIAGKPKLTYEGYEYLAKIDADSRSRKAIVISATALLTSLIPFILNYVVFPIADFLSPLMRDWLSKF